MSPRTLDGLPSAPAKLADGVSGKEKDPSTLSRDASVAAANSTASLQFRSKKKKHNQSDHSRLLFRCKTTERGDPSRPLATPPYRGSAEGRAPQVRSLVAVGIVVSRPCRRSPVTQVVTWRHWVSLLGPQ